MHLSSAKSATAYAQKEQGVFRYLPSPLYTSLKNALDEACPDCQKASSNCWIIHNRNASRFPLVWWTLKTNIHYVQTPLQYLFEKPAGSGTWCSTFMDNGAARETVLGASWMVGHDIIFDFESPVFLPLRLNLY